MKINTIHHQDQQRGQVWIWIILILVLIAGGGGVALWRLGMFKPENKTLTNIHTVSSGTLAIEVNEVGTIEARKYAMVRNPIPGRVTITWLIKEGTSIKAGDKIVELDRSKFDNDLVDQGNKRDSAQASLVNAQEELKITKSKAASDIEQAELDLKLAKLDLAKYEKGEYPRDLQKAESDITIAQEELTRAIDKEAWSMKLAEKGYVSDSDLKADQLNRKRKEIALDLAKTEKSLLEEYTQQRRLAELKNRVSQNTQSLERVKARTTADIKKSEANLINRQADFARQVQKYKDIERLISMTTLAAPVDGTAIYASSGGSRRYGRNRDPLEAGSEVTQRADLIKIPINNEMKVVAKIPEALLPKISMGLPVSLTVEAVPGQVFNGFVSKIARQPDPSGWWSNNLKVYSVDISLDGDTQMLRTGMNCEVTIQTAYHDDVISVPIQCVVGIGDKTMVYKLDENDEAIATPVTIGLDDNRKVHILSGLNIGDRILLTPPLDEAVVGPATKMQESKALKQSDEAKKVTLAATRPSVDAKILESLNRMLRVRQMGYLDRVKLPEADQKLLNGWLDKVEADELTEIDEKEFARIRAEINRQFQAARKKREGGS